MQRSSAGISFARSRCSGLNAPRRGHPLVQRARRTTTARRRTDESGARARARRTLRGRATPRLPHERLRPHYAIVVIGSGTERHRGFAHSPRGRRSCILERGRERVPASTPILPRGARGPSSHVARQLARVATALLDLHTGETSTSSSVAGRRHLAHQRERRAARRPARLRQGWPRAIVDDQDELEKGYERAERMLARRRIRARARAEEKQAGAQEVREGARAPLPRSSARRRLRRHRELAGVEQKKCTDCARLHRRVQRRCEGTLLVNYLPDAVRHGAVVFTEVRAKHVSREAGKVGRARRATRSLSPRAQRAATFVHRGTWSSSPRARSLDGDPPSIAREGSPLSDRLGARFTGNGDVLGFAYNGPEPVDGVAGGGRVVGPTITASSTDARRRS